MMEVFDLSIIEEHVAYVRYDGEDDETSAKTAALNVRQWLH